MSAPRTKRQFAGAASDPAQRQITSFFAIGHKPAPLPPKDNPSQPALPASVQASLLNVGMRIRKSVPEGYKTGGPYSGFKLFTDTTDPTALARPQHVSAASQRELLPFCGINKVGGLASQPVAIAEDDLAPVPGLDDIPALSSSQESFPGSSQPPLMSQTVNARKRFYSEEDESDVPVEHSLKVQQEWLDGEVSPRTMAPAGWGNARPMAVPRRKGGKSAVEDQENMVDDFEEAEFLDEKVLTDMDMDV